MPLLLLSTGLTELKLRSVVSIEITDSVNLAQNVFLKHCTYFNFNISVCLQTFSKIIPGIYHNPYV